MAERKYIELGEAKRVMKANDWLNPAVPNVVNMILDRLPAADVAEVVHARWITEENTEGYSGDPHCTACKGILDDEAVYGHTPGVDSFFYCPLCGAKMDGDKHETD